MLFIRKNNLLIEISYSSVIFLYFRDGRRGNFGDRGGERGGDRDPDAGRSDAGDWRSAPPPPMKEDNRYLKVQSYSIVKSKQFKTYKNLILIAILA